MRAGVLGINHKMASVSLRSFLAKACEEWFHTADCEPLSVLLSTCNRTEIYFASEDLAATHSQLINRFKEIIPIDYDQKFYTYFDRDCFYHLCRVASGLDSAVIAETEIQSQVRDAYQKASLKNLLPRQLHYLFQKSLKVSKEVRQRLTTTRGIPTLEQAITKIGDHFFKEKSDPKVLFVGASAINEKLIHHFLNRGVDHLHLINRTPKKIEGVTSIDWNQISSWSKFDWIIVGTKSQDYILKTHHSKWSNQQILIQDLSVPSNVDPRLGNHPQITLMNIDEINKTLQFQQKQIYHLLDRAEAYVEAASDRQISLYHQREHARMSYVS